MKIINQKVEILNTTSLDLIEIGGRTCYRSRMSDDDTGRNEFIRRRLSEGHESILEHSSMSVMFTTDRGVSHELVRHRLAAFSQESTRYCNYASDRFGNEIAVINPFEKVGLCNEDQYDAWKVICESAERTYFYLINSGVPAEYARSVLPTCLATHIMVTANYREWRHIMNLRTSPAAHPQLRDLMQDLLRVAVIKVPVIFDDIFEQVFGSEVEEDDYE